jgi:hypothetical protein
LDKEKADEVFVTEKTGEAKLVAEIPREGWLRVLQYEADADVLLAAVEDGEEGMKSVLRNLRRRARRQRR